MSDKARRLEQFYSEFHTQKPTFKLLRKAFKDACDEAYVGIREYVLNPSLDPRAGMEDKAVEFHRVFGALNNVIYPLEPRPAEMNATNFAGSDHVECKMVPYIGSADHVRLIFERSVGLVRLYTDAIGRGDFHSAYTLTASGLRAWMSLKRFVTAHEQATRRYGGPALEFHIKNFQFVLADEGARKKSKADEGWAKSTPKEERRSCLIGFWVRDRSAQTGCWGGFLLSEENGEYRIAKFTFYTQ